ncbi:MAG TPA: PEGA domain-containing protein, partial [Ignavibacteriales bacterium]|nr:PEGA domain-containing protein [Ignavibacteriales bacterium]
MRFISLMLSGILFFCLSADMAYSQQDSLKENILVLMSEPAGASVYIDSAFMGVTPLEIRNLKNGKYIAALRMDGFKDKSYFIEMTGGSVEKYAIMSGDYALININSEPSEADFYLNDVYIGKTPISDLRTPLGILKIGLKKNLYKETDIFINAISYKYKITKNLEPNYGVFHFNNVNEHSFYIDGIKTDIIGDSFYVNKGKHIFMFEGAPLYHDIIKEINVEAPQLYDIRFEYNTFTFRYAFASLFIPGLGQIFDSSLKEGYGILLGASITGAYIFATNNAYN